MPYHSLAEIAFKSFGDGFQGNSCWKMLEPRVCVYMFTRRVSGHTALADTIESPTGAAAS